MKRKKKLKLAAQMDSIPLRNKHVRATLSEDPDSLVVEIELQYRGWLLPLQGLLGLRTKKRYELDSIGREIYESIDGRKTFESLIDTFAEKHKLTFFESRGLLSQYLQILMKRGLVVMGVRESE